MTDSDAGVRRLRIDAELLARLGPNSSRDSWERTLRRCGLLDLGAVGGPVGDQIREIQLLMQSWPRPASEDPNLGMGAPRGHVIRVSTGMALAYTSAIGLGVLWSLAAGNLYGVAFTLIVVAVVAYLRSRLAEPEVRAQEDGHYARRIADRMQDLLSRSFVAAIGETVVENTPHVEWLEVREEQLDAAARATEDRMAQIGETIAHIQATNERLGRSAEDLETVRLRRLLDEQRLGMARIRKLRDEVETKRAALVARIDVLRAVADRDALSERVARMAHADHATQRAVAEIDVDILEVESAFAALALDAKDADQRRAAVLEVVGASRALSRG